jgi:hypothetical protein
LPAYIPASGVGQVRIASVIDVPECIATAFVVRRAEAPESLSVEVGQSEQTLSPVGRADFLRREQASRNRVTHPS